MFKSFSSALQAKLWPDLPFCYHFYRLGMAVVFFSIFKVIVFSEKAASPLLIGIACALFCAGFCQWLAKFVVVVIRHDFSRTVMTFVHAGVLVGAYLAARWVVALVTGLPSKDFDGTVAVLAILCAALLYIMLLALVCSAIALGCFLAVWVTESAGMVSKIPGVRSACAWMEKRFRFRFFYQPDLKPLSLSIRFLAHWMAGVLVAGLVWHGLQLAVNASINNSQLMKHLAYYVDYQLADRYPGIGIGQRFVLHDNNVISLARDVNGQIEIAVGVIDPLNGVAHLSEYR